MGASSSRIEDDKALQLCRERKKFVRQALDGRCSLAATHVAYIESLKIIGTVLRRFVEPEAPIESSLYTSTSATPEPLALTEKSLSQFSYSSPSLSRVDATENLSPYPSPPTSGRYQENHMKFRGTLSRKVVEKPSVPVMGSVTSSSTPQNTTPRSTERPEMSPFEASSIPPGIPPWDYFGLFHPIENHFSSQEVRGMNQGLENADDIRWLREEEGIPELEDEEEKVSTLGSEESQESEDEFDEPSTDTLVRTFENVNRAQDHLAASASPAMPSAESVASEAEFVNGEKSNSPDLTPLRAPSSGVAVPNDIKRTLVKENGFENKVAPKDFFSSMKDIEYLFVKASDSGREVPRMLEANKFHFRPIFPGKERGSMTSTLLKTCFSCGEDPSQVQEVKSLEDKGLCLQEVPQIEAAKGVPFLTPNAVLGAGVVYLEFALIATCPMNLWLAGLRHEKGRRVFDRPSDQNTRKGLFVDRPEAVQTTVKYLTWHRTTSSRSSSSRNPLGGNSKDEIEDLTSNLFDNFCMISGSHVSTLDRLYAWERKLYDEVKASEIVRSAYDTKCKLLRQLESKGESSHRIDKTRAVVKDLHSRIRVAIHRIDSISKKIEELRDKELQPQLEELIEGLRRMWEVMFQCHKLQFHIISIAYNNGNTKISIQSESHRQITIHLENELSSLYTSFTKWIGAQKSYVHAINEWLLKCVSLQQKSSKRKRRMQGPPLRNYGPPIYVTCGVWLDKLVTLPTKEVAESIKVFAAEIARFLPHQEKNQGNGMNHPPSTSWQAGSNSESAVPISRDEAPEDWITGSDRFRSSLVGFIDKLNNFAESSVKVFSELQKAIQEAKNSYDQFKSQL